MSIVNVDDIYDRTGTYKKQQVVQVVNVTDGAVATGTTVVGASDAIMQNTQGDQYMSLAITPKSATNILRIESIIHCAHSVATAFILAGIFQDSIADNLAVGWEYSHAVNYNKQLQVEHYMVAGTTSSTTFKIRVGSNQVGTTTFNGQASSRRQGGKLCSSITITEYQPS